MSTDLNTLLLGSSRASEERAEGLAEFDRALAKIDRAIADAEQAAKPTALAPRVCVTAPSERPTDQAFAYFVKFFRPKGTPRGTLILWTDSAAYAKEFAKEHHVYARPSTVQARSEWASGRAIGLSEEAR